MACCLAASSYYLNQHWLMIIKVQWQSPEGNFHKRDLRHQLLRLVWELLIKNIIEISQGPMSYSSWMGHHYTVRCCYDGNFLANIHKKHLIARPLGRVKGCLLRIQHLFDILPQFLQLFMQYLTILDHVIMALDCIRIHPGTRKPVRSETGGLSGKEVFCDEENKCETFLGVNLKNMIYQY